MAVFTPDAMTSSNFAFLDPPVAVKRTSRKGSVGFKVTKDGVTVLAPSRISNRELETIVQTKALWINQTWEKAQRQQTPQRLYQTGESFPFLGHDYPLSIIQTDRRQVELDTGEICIDLDRTDSRDIQQQCETMMAEWLQRQAEDYLPQRLKHWADITTWQPNSLKIRDYKSRWGSCDQFGRITLNNRLMMAPEGVIDYVIIHELAHLLELNHSTAFWTLVGRHCPSYKTQRNWLRKHSHSLQISADI